jgi:ribose transport system substrate-binding protein
MKKLLIILAAAGLVLSAEAAMAQQKKTLAVVVKGLDNPFFTVLGNGCKKWNDEHPDSEYECLYTGPALTSDEAGEVQLVADLIAKGVAGIAISPSNAPAMASMLKEKKPQMPIMTIDADLQPEDRGLRKTYLGTENYQMGVLMAKHLAGLKPKGGKVCLQLGNVAANNINERAAGFRDTISGQKGAERLTGQGGWTEVDGCPLYTNDDFPLSVQQMEDVLGKYPKLDAFIPTGGFPQFIPQAYKKVAEKYKSRIDDGSLALVVADTLPVQMDLMKAGLSKGQVGQRPFEMGYKTMYFLKDIKEGKPAPADPTYTGLDVCTPETADTCIGK